MQGDILAVLDGSGNTLGEYEYDAWGNILSQGSNVVLELNPFRYRGYYYDEETGLYYLNSRYYDPETGRFISPDSLKYLEPTHNNGLNLYAYCGNNPIKYSDPTGCSIVLQFIISLFTFAGYAIVSIWDAKPLQKKWDGQFVRSFMKKGSPGIKFQPKNVMQFKI